MSDEDSHGDKCQVVMHRQNQINRYGRIVDVWPQDVVCTCHLWWRYNSKVPPAWYVAELVSAGSPTGDEPT